MRFKTVSLTIALTAAIFYSQTTLGQEKTDEAASASVAVVQTNEMARVVKQALSVSEQAQPQATPRIPGRQPCRRPSGEPVANRTDTDDELFNIDKR